VNEVEYCPDLWANQEVGTLRVFFASFLSYSLLPSLSAKRRGVMSCQIGKSGVGVGIDRFVQKKVVLGRRIMMRERKIKHL
jgi:hypothetical protein